MLNWLRLQGHGRYRELLTARLDGRLDARGQARLQAPLAGCDECRRELNELEATVALLRSTPVAESPRSFALPYAPRQEGAAASREWPGALRGAQMATAAAALFLVAVVTVDLTGTIGGGIPRELDPASDGASTSQQMPSAAPEAAAGGLAPDPAADGRMATDEATSTFEPSAEASGRTALQWVLGGAALATAALALSVVTATWRFARF